LFVSREKGELLTFAGEPTKAETFVVLQKLDTNANKHHLFLDKEQFKPNLKDWANVPVVFAKGHPKKNNFRTNPEAALAECKGKILGHPSDVRLETSGTPRLTANLPLDDPEAQRLREDGKLLHSVAYASPDDGVRLTGPVEPDHVLLFPAVPGARAGDPGTIMYGPEGEEAGRNEEERGLLKRILNFMLRREEKSNSQGETDMPTDKEFQEVKAENEKNATALKTVQDEFKAFQEKAKAEATARVEAEKKLKDFQDAEAKAKLESHFKTYASQAPKGWTEGKAKSKDAEGKDIEVEKIDVLRKDFQADPIAAYEKLKEFQGKRGADKDFQGTGQEHAGGAAEGKYPSVGRWDPKANANKGGWVDE
jgi:hypothetical protein